MALLISYAPSMDQRSLRVLPQQPLWLRHRARGGPLVSHGDYPRPDNWGVLLCCRFVASAATKSISSASAWEQNLPVARSGCHPSLAMNKLQLPARAQGRAFCSYTTYGGEEGPLVQPGNRSKLVEGINILKDAVGMLKNNHSESEQAKKNMLEGILILEKLADDEHHYGDSDKAHKLLTNVVSPLRSNLGNHDLEVIVEPLLRTMCLLLQNAPGEVGSKLRRTISGDKILKSSLEKIRDSGGSADKAGALAQKILAQLSSSPE